MILEAAQYPEIRASVAIDLVTVDSLKDEVIAQSRYHPMAELDVRSAVTALKEINASHTLAQIAVAVPAFADADKQLILKSAVVARTAWRLVPYVRQLTRFQAGEQSEDYAEMCWSMHRRTLLDEYTDYISSLNDGTGVFVPYVFTLGKSE